ncbi:MAG: CPCC family cysteine-rich protein [Candidatus Solibacter sp.]|jgi:hypothetical protein
MHVCPVCGYRALPFAPVDYHICPCCGTEFGADDVDFSHEELRSRWIDGGMRWFSKVTPPPKKWSPVQQLLAAGFGLHVA